MTKLHIAYTATKIQAIKIKSKCINIYNFVSSTKSFVLSKAVEESGRTSSAGSICLVSSW